MSSRKRKRKQKQKQQRKSSPSGKPSGKQVCGGAEPGDLIPSHDALEELTNDRDYKNIRKSADAGSVPTKLTGLAGLAILTPVAFFAALAVCVRVFVQPELIYHSFYRLIASAPRFQIGWAFCRESLTTVGGPLAYLYGFLSHCFYYPWVGTLILTLVAGLLWLVNRMLLKVTRAYDPPLLCYLYAIFLLAGAISYNHLLLVALSVLTALAVLVGYIWTIGASRPRAGMVFTVGLAVVFWGAGSAAILFGLLAAFYELTVRRRVILAGAFAASTLVVYYLSTVQFELPICFVQSMARSVDTRQAPPLVKQLVLGSVYAMYLLGFLTLAYIAIHRFLVDRKAAPGSADRAKSATVRPFGLALTIRGAGAILPLALLPLPIYQCSTSTEKLDLLSSYYCSRSEWGRVIELNCRGGQAEHEQYSVNLNHDLNRALYHTGQLGETMFEYRQTLPALLLMKTADVMHPPATAIRRIEVMMELGHLGSAEQMALELLETSDGWPLVVEKLAHLQLVKRQNETARIFLNNLAKDLVHAPGAKRLLRCLDKDPELTAYTPVQHLRSIANETDQPLAVVSTEMFFGDLLRKNPRNKMAFEYMMTQYLLTARLDKFLDNIHRLKDLGYDKSPRHYEEALAVMTVNGASPQAMHGYRPSPEAIGKAARFEKICNSFSYRENDEASRKAAISAARKKLQGLFWANIYIL